MISHITSPYSFVPERTIGPLFVPSAFKDAKDPCIVHDKTTWHIYGSGGDVRSERWRILHATAPSIEGPWTEIDPAVLLGVVGDHVAAPSVLYDPDDRKFHMAVQTEFMSVGGTIEYLVSTDGVTFQRIATALESLPNTPEAGIYDPHYAAIGDDKYLVYAGTPLIEGFHGQLVIQPDIYLAKSQASASGSSSWAGPWERMGKILDHADIDWHHNPRHHPEYEWGIEGPQVIALPDGSFLLNATCFLDKGRFGTRQRVFFALAESITGPYRSVGPVIAPPETIDDWQSGENGHATAMIHDAKLYLFYQGRSAFNPDAADNHWRYGIAVFPLSSAQCKRGE